MEKRLRVLLESHDDSGYKIGIEFSGIDIYSVARLHHELRHSGISEIGSEEYVNQRVLEIASRYGFEERDIEVSLAGQEVCR